MNFSTRWFSARPTAGSARVAAEAARKVRRFIVMSPRICPIAAPPVRGQWKLNAYTRQYLKLFITPWPATLGEDWGGGRASDPYPLPIPTPLSRERG